MPPQGHGRCPDMFKLIQLGHHCTGILSPDLNLLLPAMKLRQGNVFTPLCDSVHRGGSLPRGSLCPGGVSVQGRSLSSGSLSGGFLSGGLCPGESLSRGGSLYRGGSLSGRPPTSIRLQVGSTHPTGMHSSLI